MVPVVYMQCRVPVVLKLYYKKTTCPSPMDEEPAQPIVTTIVILGILPSLFICCICIMCIMRSTELRRRLERRQIRLNSLSGSIVLRIIHPEHGSAPCADRGLCCVCSDYESNVVFEPCSHDLFCTRCAVIIWMTSRACPLCRSPVESIMHGGEPLGLSSTDGQLLSHSIGNVVHNGL